jgi:hypothetical protein
MTTDMVTDIETAEPPILCGEMPKGDTAETHAPSEQDDDRCGRCREAPCICDWLPTSWGPNAHESYRVYARKRSAKREQEAAS